MRVTGIIASLAVIAGLLLTPLSGSKAAPRTSANDTARYLAGLIPSKTSPLIGLTRDRAWARHAKIMDQAWTRLEAARLTKLKAWSKRELSSHSQTMLYMFSGPDFLYADGFFPNAKTYILSALEAVGPVPDLIRLSRGSRIGTLSHLRASLQTSLSYSFFVTKKMKTDLHQGYVRGALPLLYVFLARTGKKIHNVQLVGLDRNGALNPRGRRTKRGNQPGVMITFSSGNKRGKQTLYYFATDLSNIGLKRSGFKRFVENLGPADSLLKSASYLLHSRNFKTARNLVLDQSSTIIQDDSGVPIRFFKRDEWNLRPFGKYRGPISLFAQHYQRGMKRLFARGRTTQVKFGIGYRWRHYETNILLARKKPVRKAMR